MLTMGTVGWGPFMKNETNVFNINVNRFNQHLKLKLYPLYLKKGCLTSLTG